MSNNNKEIHSSRVITAPLNNTYNAFANPEHLKNWWGPNGFTNTIHEFDLRSGGKWLLTMHGPEKGHYENSSIFQIVEPEVRVAWKRVSQPLFDMEVAFEAISESQTKISFRMTFATAEECDKLRRFVVPNNEENFDRLEAELKKMKNN